VSDEHPTDERPPADSAPRPSFGRSLGLFWLYTVLRFGLFGAIWLVLWLVGVEWLFAAAIAVVLSIPLSWFLLARPRQAFAANIEQRVNARFEHKTELDARLEGATEPASTDENDGADGDR
jgi:hypothetical protein